MSDGGSVLPQAEIDALFKQATGKSISPPPEAAAGKSSEAPGPPANPVPVNPAPVSAEPPHKAEPELPPTATPTPSNDVLTTIQVTLDDLARRISIVESNISKLGQKEERTADVSLPIQKLSQRLETVVKNLQKVNNRVGGVLSGLEGTPGYGIRNDFTCQSCGSHGFVAIPMRCTGCGEEGWWGWWPKEK